jgi:hypothetical protein
MNGEMKAKNHRKTNGLKINPVRRVLSAVCGKLDEENRWIHLAGIKEKD